MPKEFDRGEFLTDHVPYRLQAVARMTWALSFVYTHGEETPLKVSVGGRVVVHGRVRSFTSPTIESGLVYLRGLMEFLGLKADAKKTSLTFSERKRADSVFVE